MPRPPSIPVDIASGTVTALPEHPRAGLPEAPSTRLPSGATLRRAPAPPKRDRAAPAWQSPTEAEASGPSPPPRVPGLAAQQELALEESPQDGRSPSHRIA